MDTQFSRRTLAKGAAWSLPTMVAAAPVRAATASSICPPDVDLNAGVCDRRIADAWEVIGGKRVMSAGGRLLLASTTMNFGTRSPCFNRGLVNWKLHNRTAHRGLPTAQLFLRDGTAYSGVATLGSDQGGGARVGFIFSVTIQWENSKWSAKKDWQGATVHLPMLLHYTAPNGSLKSCQLKMVYEMSSGFSGVLKPMVNPHFEIM